MVDPGRHRKFRHPIGNSIDRLQLGSNLITRIAQTPAVHEVARRVELGGALSLSGVCLAAQPFTAALVRHLHPNRPLLVVTEGVKAQERFDQDITTWTRLFQRTDRPLYYPAWEVLPHESKLPHADIISERLETLVALAQPGTAPSAAPLIVTNVIALMQRTFPKGIIAQRTRALIKGDHIDPLDLVEWLEDQGYEPEAKVTQKGEIALRGGILDLYPLTSPWPVRLEFFGEELDSLRHFDPISQISREPIERVVLPPGGELALLRSLTEPGGGKGGSALGTLLDHLPASSIILLCEPEALAEHAATYAKQIPDGDPFFIDWERFLWEMDQAGLAQVLVSEAETGKRGGGWGGGARARA